MYFQKASIYEYLCWNKTFRTDPKPVSSCYQDHQALKMITDMFRGNELETSAPTTLLNCTANNSQVKENFSFSRLPFEKATKKSPRAKSSNGFRMKYKGYSEHSKVLTTCSAFPRLQSWWETTSWKKKCSQSCRI